ncbi:MAG: glycosyltransferase [Candidatus Moraniibacteriota bacterium]|nr:MAG: glycosyltransferase [Candidatus Moranbacteria bacterium]
MEKSQYILKGMRNIGKVALVHDFLLYRGGAERVLRTLADMFPEAPIYTLLYDREGMQGMFADREVRTSFLGAWPKFLQRRHRWLLPFYSAATEAIDVRDFDVVISSSGAWVKGIVTRLRTKHIAYIHSPMRFVWDENERYLRESGGFHFCKRMMLSHLRLWDFEAAARPDVLVANSRYTQARIEKYYRRPSDVVSPPVRRLTSTEPAALDMRDRPFVTVSRLSKYKHTEAIVQAFAELLLPLVVVGMGRELARLQRIAPPNVRFLGDISDDELGTVLGKARAFVFAGEEDFGLALAEAQMAGLPAIALASGGAREIVEENVSGVFFADPDAQSVIEAVQKYIKRESSFDTNEIRKNAERFSECHFQECMADVIRKVVG